LKIDSYDDDGLSKVCNVTFYNCIISLYKNYSIESIKGKGDQHSKYTRHYQPISAFSGSVTGNTQTVHRLK